MVDEGHEGVLTLQHAPYSPRVPASVEQWEDKHRAGEEEGRVVKAPLGGRSSVLMRETEAQADVE